MAFVITCKMVVRWKNGAAPIVVPGMRVGIATSVFAVRVAICDGLASKTHEVENYAHSRNTWRRIRICANYYRINLSSEWACSLLIRETVYTVGLTNGKRPNSPCTPKNMQFPLCVRRKVTLHSDMSHIDIWQECSLLA
jgi:hypothetical protein